MLLPDGFPLPVFSCRHSTLCIRPKGGTGIAKIRAQAEPEIRQIFAGRKLRLDLRVKAQDKWRTNPIILDKILH